MTLKNNSLPEMPANAQTDRARRNYRRPVVVDYGTVSNLTKGAGTQADDGSGGFQV